MFRGRTNTPRDVGAWLAVVLDILTRQATSWPPSFKLYQDLDTESK